MFRPAYLPSFACTHAQLEPSEPADTLHVHPAPLRLETFSWVTLQLSSSLVGALVKPLSCPRQSRLHGTWPTPLRWSSQSRTVCVQASTKLGGGLSEDEEAGHSLVCPMHLSGLVRELKE